MISKNSFFKKYFPSWVFSRAILIQAILTLLIFAWMGFLVRSFFLTQLTPLLGEAERIRIFTTFDSFFLYLFFALTLVLGMFAIVLARHLVFPIGRMILKTKSILNPESAGSPGQMRTDAATEIEEPQGVWSDLASSIEEIRQDLQTKIESLKTEREEQATLMGAISDAILAVDLEEAPLFYNTRFALQFENQISAFKKENQEPEKLSQIFKTPEILGAFHRALENGRTEQIKALPFDLPSGKRFFSLSVSPLRNAREAIYGAVGIFHDVTDLKRAEQIRIDFVANVSHELRTPLTAIKGYADTLEQDLTLGRPIDPEFLQVIVRNSDRLMNLINDLLDLSSLESTDVLQKTPVSTDELTQRVLHQLRGAFAKKKQSVVQRCQTPSVLADPKRIEQVLVNLLDNANKYTPEEGVITVLWNQDNSDTVLKVEDNGPGIPSEHQPRLFERFYRIDKDRSREKGGTGLGLAIVKHILQRHDGSVNIESTTGRGSTFICKFPNS